MSVRSVRVVVEVPLKCWGGGILPIRTGIPVPVLYYCTVVTINLRIVVHTLGYADDAALLDYTDEVASDRVTTIAQGSADDADMIINVAKTQCMHVQRQEVCPLVTDDEIRMRAKFVCPHINCNHVFYNQHGLKVHAARCKKRDVYNADKIIDVKGATGTAKRKFKVRWDGYGANDDTWEPRSHLPPKMITEFLKTNGLYDYNWSGARCPKCDKPCKNERGVKNHLRHCYCNNVGRQTRQNFCQRKAKQAAQLEKRKASQANEKQILCNGSALENIYLFKYLGSLFAADGSQAQDVARRSSMAKARCGQLRNIFSSPDVTPELKLSIYKSAVMSLMTYGCEAWSMTAKTKAKINGTNARCLARITGRSVHTEASQRTQTFDVIMAIRQRKWKWLGHILRTPGERLTKLAIKVQFDKQDRLNMLQDVPHFCKTFEQLQRLAQDRQVWRNHQPSGLQCNKNRRAKPTNKYQLRKRVNAMTTTPRIHMTVTCSVRPTQPKKQLKKNPKVKTPVTMKGPWSMFQLQRPKTKKPKKVIKRMTYEEKLAEYQKTLPTNLPNIPTRTAQEEFERAHWNDLHFIGHKTPHLYGVPLKKVVKILPSPYVDATLTSKEEEYYDNRAREEATRQAKVATMLKRARRRFKKKKGTVPTDNDNSTTATKSATTQPNHPPATTEQTNTTTEAAHNTTPTTVTTTTATTNTTFTTNIPTISTITNATPATTTTTTPTTSTTTTPNSTIPISTQTTTTSAAIRAVFDTSSEDEYSYSESHDSNSYYSVFHAADVDDVSADFQPHCDVNKLLPARLQPTRRTTHSPSVESQPTPPSPLSPPLYPLISNPPPNTNTNLMAPNSPAPTTGIIPIPNPPPLSPIPLYIYDKLMNDSFDCH